MSNEEIKVIFLKHWKSTTEILNKSIDELKENIMKIEKTDDFSYYRKLQKESEELEKTIDHFNVILSEISNLYRQVFDEDIPNDYS